MAAVDLDANWSARLLAIYASRVRPAVVFSMLDATVIALSMAAALLLRFDGHPPPGMWPKAIAFALAAIVVFLAWGRRLGVYGQVWSYASIREAGQVLLTGVLATLTLTVLSVAAAWASQTATDGGAGLGLFQGEPMPRSVPMIGGILATGVLGLTRYQSRLFSRRRMDAPSTQTRVLIVGAGEIGAWLVHQFRETAAVVPVGFVDDAPAKRHGRIGAVRVLGDSSDIADLVQRHLVDEVIVAIGTPDPEHLRRVAAAARSAGAVVKTVPTVSEILFKGMRPDDLRSLETEQLLGRTSVQTDLTHVRDLIRGRTVLVTGAGGSIGSEIARQVSAAEPARLLVLDNDETHLHDLRPDLPDDVTEYLLADIRDGSRIRRLVDLYRPSVVFHAAAHKHVPILEQHPSEAVQTNVLGTRELLRACHDAEVEHFILISTDKAVAPSSVMGASKRVAELLVADMARQSGRHYVSVRFGNVLGSRGSVVPIFARQIREGGPVTITDPRMTRYFMTIPEATHLVLQAAGLARGGEILMLAMGDPVSIVSLAEQMIRASGCIPGVDIEIQVTGTRPGEKLAEVLVDEQEAVSATAHPSILRIESHTPDGAILEGEIDMLADLGARGEEALSGRLLMELAHLRSTGMSEWTSSMRLEESCGTA